MLQSRPWFLQVLPYSLTNYFLAFFTMRKIILLTLCLFLPLGTFAEATNTDTDVIISQMKAILDQYGARVKALEAENAILRNEMMKAGIKIPLSAFSGAIITTVSPATSVATGSPASSSTGSTPTVSSSTGVSDEVFVTISKQHSPRYASFIQKVRSDWPGILSAYKLPQTAFIWGYEFVKQGNDNHAFVDIVFSGTTVSGVYDAKILYEYHTGTYQRKLVGFFEYNKATWYYKTRTWSNPFAGVTRTFVADPNSSRAPSQAPSQQDNSVWAGTVSLSAIPSLADVEKAYTDKRYLTTISLSAAYLSANPATVDVLRIRYRTFFIIGKYSESLAEIAKIESLWKLEKAIACDAQVIATYSKTQSLVDKYTKICKS